MINCSLNYKNHEQLKNFINEQSWSEEKSLLIQVFTGINEHRFIQMLLNELNALLPHAQIIGTTTAGEISQEDILTHSTVLSFTCFEHTHIKTFIQPNETACSFELGQTMMQNIDKEHHNQKLQTIITFTDGLKTNGEEYLNGMNSVDSNIPIAGGMAGDNSLFTLTYVFAKNTIVEQGAVCVALYNNDLQVYTDYNFSWQSLGKSHVIEKSEKNRVYTIDGMSAIDFYAYYLGDEIAQMLPSVGVEFPLVIKKDGLDIARAVLNRFDDGSLGFAGNIPQGSLVKFGYGDVQMILQRGLFKAKQLINQPVEAIFIYSCTARKALLQDEIRHEIKPLNQIAPTTGFFTYGEFYYGKKHARLLNQSMTILALSESEDIHHIEEDSLQVKVAEKEQSMHFYRTQALSKLISKTTKELEELNDTLEQRVRDEVRKSLEKDEVLYATARHAQMGEILDMIVHQWRQPLNVFSAGVSSLQLYHNMGVLTDEVFNQTTMQVLKNVDFLNSTIEDFRGFFKNTQVKERIEPSKILDKCCVLFESMFKKLGIELHRKVEFDETFEVCSSELIQVVLNIFKNAIDAIEENHIPSPMIACRVYKQNNCCIFEIMDNAGGIPLDILPKIFDKRFTTKGETHGTGIGLDMSKTIVEEHLHGTLTAGNVKQGAVFTITIPLHT